MRNAQDFKIGSLVSKRTREMHAYSIPLKYRERLRGSFAVLSRSRRSSLYRRATRCASLAENLINACQIIPTNSPESYNPSVASAADSRPTVGVEHQFVCGENKRNVRVSPALPDACARARAHLQCILNILPVVQRLSANAALVYLCLARARRLLPLPGKEATRVRLSFSFSRDSGIAPSDQMSC